MTKALSSAIPLPMLTSPSFAVEWRVSAGLTPYDTAVAAMETRVHAMLTDDAGELIWLVEHPPVYTAGTAAQADGLLEPRFPVHETGRGGQYTYHGPGQRVAYAMLDLKRLFAPSPPDLRAYVKMLEEWIILTLKEFGVQGFTREGRVGVWVESPAGEAKIAAIGVRVRKWIAYHGICLNVNPDLSHYAGIVPCGIREYGVTSLRQLGVNATINEVDLALKKSFETVSGLTASAGTTFPA